MSVTSPLHGGTDLGSGDEASRGKPIASPPPENHLQTGRPVHRPLDSSRSADDTAMKARKAKFGIGQVVRHRRYPFRGVIYDIDPVFSNTEEWWLAIPEDLRPRRDQPFYHLLAENGETEYVAYVSEQNLLPDRSDEPLRHPQIDDMFVRLDDGSFKPKGGAGH